MLRFLTRLDQFVSTARPAFLWIGQLAVVTLGVHLAADRLDDYLSPWLTSLAIAWPSPEAPLTAATWVAIAVELAVVAWAAWTLIRSSAEPTPTARDWWDNISVRAVLAPLFWAPTALAGAWVVGMAIEDLTADWLLDYAPYLAWTVAALVAWRLAGTGWVRIVRRGAPAKHWFDGIFWAPPVLLVTALAVKHGLPIWGWIQ